MSTHHHHDHDHGGVDPPRVEEVAEGVFAYVQPDGTWWINNAGFVAARDGVVAVDTCATERRTRQFLESVRTVTTAPVRTVVNTHHHGDHTNGNYLTYPATIVAQERCRENLLAFGTVVTYDGVFETPEAEIPDWGDLQLAPPTVTFEDRIDLWADETRIELHYIGTPAHTTGDVVAWLPDQQVLYSGDLVFNGGTPFVLMGSVTGSLTALERLRQFDAEVVVPGHGEVCTMEVVDGLSAYLRFVLKVAADMVTADVEPLEAARSVDLGEFAHLTDPERLVGNLHRARAELTGTEPGGEIDLLTAIGDMLTYNGGRPLRCLV